MPGEDEVDAPAGPGNCRLDDVDDFAASIDDDMDSDRAALESRIL